MSDPLQSLETPDTEDIFSSTFKGSAGKVKITATTEQIETGVEKSDPTKLVADLTPEDDDLFSDCRSDHSPTQHSAGPESKQGALGSNSTPGALGSSSLPASAPIARSAPTAEMGTDPQSKQIKKSERPNYIGIRPNTVPQGQDERRDPGVEIGGRVEVEVEERVMAAGEGGTGNGERAVAAGPGGVVGEGEEAGGFRSEANGSVGHGPAGPFRRCESRGEDEFVTVTVAPPHKVGEGLSSYMAYRVSTRTNLKCFRRVSFSVVRRFSDFLGLYEKLVARYQYKGRIIPPPPEKSILGTTKAKMGSQDAQTPAQDGLHTKATFISLRRAALERFINRVGVHPVLRVDSDYVDFLEAGGDLPRATSTSALSSASVMKMISRVGETVNKMAYKMEEGDPWFEEKTTHVEQMETQLRKLLGIVEAVVSCRRELAISTGNLSASLATLSSCEEAFHLSRTLEGLARVEENVETTLEEQADADCAHLLELIRDYLGLIASVKDVLGERVKLFLAWQTAVNTLHKKREQRSRLELGGKLERMGAVLEDVTEWEARVEETQDNFNKISEVIKVEMELFQHYRVADLKGMVVLYLEALSHSQLDMVNHWENFLPDVKRVM